MSSLLWLQQGGRKVAPLITPGNALKILVAHVHAWDPSEDIAF